MACAHSPPSTVRRWSVSMTVASAARSSAPMSTGPTFVGNPLQQSRGCEMDAATPQALEAARLALLSHNNCLITDRPDLPRSAETSWTTDFTRVLALIDAALCRSTSDGVEPPETATISMAPALVSPLCVSHSLPLTQGPDQISSLAFSPDHLAVVVPVDCACSCSDCCKDRVAPPRFRSQSNGR